MSKKRIHIVPNGFTPDGASSDKSLEWLEANYLGIEEHGRVECPVCFSTQLTVLDIRCSNCGTFVAENRQPIDKDGLAKLPGGISAGELMKRAERWWNATGRGYFRRVRARPGDSIMQTPALRYGSGILMGKHFDDLTRREKFAVCKTYHLAWLEENTEQSKPDVAAIVI